MFLPSAAIVRREDEGGLNFDIYHSLRMIKILVLALRQR